ncbi:MULTISPECIES: DUF3817 domain-containing protein [Nesterenkonia]|uniref:Integral membrane protein n=2 Tax=Nesterenkonia TaxID=57494 RepID=A0A839FL93_9MICC|nr:MULTISPECIES: DUF3817 domain-containing protein [Nesterenkonia]MBA8920205.1 integral membrane protein [Nesterenkonia jeotgali]NYJ15582.1 integral membrane protein [Nesterenkonia sandarakina]
MSDSRTGDHLTDASATDASTHDASVHEAGVHDDLPPAPPRPRQRRFGGTAAQIQGSLTFYKAFAFITGIMLLILVAKMIMDYGFGYELYAGGTTADGAENTLGFHPKDSVVDGTGISYWIAVIHGWIYVVYIIAGFRLWYLMNWKVGRLVTIVLGGVVPFLSFVVERKIAREVRVDMESNPEAVRRY